MVTITVRLTEREGMLGVEINHDHTTATVPERFARDVYAGAIDAATQVVTQLMGGGKSLGMTTKAENMTPDQKEALINAAKIKFFGGRR